MADYTTSRTLREITRILASRFWIMLVIFLIPPAAVWVATSYAPKEYRSEVQLMTRPDVSVETLTEPQAASLRERISLFVATQSEVITSDHVLASAMLRLQGAEGPEPFSGESLRARRDEALSRLDARAEALSPAEYEEKRIAILDRYAQDRTDALAAWRREQRRWDQRVATYIETHPKPLRRLRQRVEVVTPGGPEASFTQLFSIRVDWPEEPDLAAERDMDSRTLAARRAREMAEHLVVAYRVRYSQIQAEQTENAVRRVAEIATYRENLDEANRQMREFIQRPEVQGSLLHLINMYGKQGGGLETGIAASARQVQEKVRAVDVQKTQLKARRRVINREVDRKAELDALQQRFDVLRKVQQDEPLGTDERQQWQARRTTLSAAIRADGAENVTPQQILRRGFRDLVDAIRGFEPVVPDWAAMHSSEIRDTQAKAVRLQLSLDEQTTSLSYLHEDVLRTAEELLMTWQRLRAKLAVTMERIDGELEVREAQLETLQEQLFGTDAVDEDGMARRLKTLEPLAVEYDQLRDKVSRAQDVYSKAWTKRLEAMEVSQAAPQPILPSVVDGPNMPDPSNPHWPILWLNVLVGAVAGLVLSLVYAFLADHFDHTIKSTDDAERYIGAPVLASIPRLGWRIIRR